MQRSIFPLGLGLWRREQIVFLAINRTGSSSLRWWMDDRHVAYHMNRYREDEARKLHLVAETKLKHRPCFTVVRSPWSRAVSSWKWCMQEKGLAPCSFEEFLRIPLASMTKQQRFHTLPQWRHVVDENDSIKFLDHVGRLETIELTRDWLADTLQLSRGESLPHLKRSGSDDSEKYYTPETRRLVAEIFRRDFELFGYPQQ
jgi:hypothetical protein